MVSPSSHQQHSCVVEGAVALDKLDAHTKSALVSVGGGSRVALPGIFIRWDAVNVVHNGDDRPRNTPASGSNLMTTPYVCRPGAATIPALPFAAAAHVARDLVRDAPAGSSFSAATRGQCSDHHRSYATQTRGSTAPPAPPSGGAPPPGACAMGCCQPNGRKKVNECRAGGRKKGLDSVDTCSRLAALWAHGWDLGSDPRVCH